MQTKVENLKDNRVKVQLTIDAADVDTHIKKTYKDFAYKYNFPGFRRGHAPRPVIDNALGKEAVLATVTDALVNDNYPLAIDECDLYPIAKPEFADEEKLVEAGKPFTFAFTVEVKPNLELTSYEPLEIELLRAGATEDEINEQIDYLREHYYSFEDASAATTIKEGGFADIAMKATDDAGENIETLSSESRMYGLGTGLFPESFDSELIGMKKGSHKTFSIDVPEQGAVLMTSLAGKTTKVNFDVEVKAVKNKVLPEVTDEWAKDTLGFKDAAELRERITESVSKQKEDVLPRMKENACLEKLRERLSGEAPQALVEEAESNLLQDFFRQLQHQGVSFDAYLAQENLTSDQFRDDVKKQAADIANQELALDAWARHFEMKATDKQISDEFVLSGAEDPEELEQQWRKSGQLYMVRQGVLRKEALDDVMTKAKVTEVDSLDKDKKADSADKKKTSANKKATSASKKEASAAKKGSSSKKGSSAAKKETSAAKKASKN